MANRLGKGLSALLGEEAVNAAQSDGTEKDASGIREIDVNDIARNEAQPRKRFDEEKLAELSESIKLYGIVSPIIVNRGDNGYVIVAGERRYRAARIAGLKSVPCIVKELSDREHMELSLIENLQREDLNPVETAEAIRLLMDEYELTQEEVADRIAKPRSSVANSLRLLALSPETRAYVADGSLSFGHAKVIAGLRNPESQTVAATWAVKRGLSVRDTEKLVAEMISPRQKEKKDKPKLPAELKWVEENLATSLGTKVKLLGDYNKGRIVIEYYDSEQLDGIYSYLTEKS